MRTRHGRVRFADEMGWTTHLLADEAVFVEARGEEVVEQESGGRVLLEHPLEAKGCLHVYKRKKLIYIPEGDV